MSSRVAHSITHKWQKDRHEAAKMAHIATMQYFINITEEQCGADWLAAVVRFCHLWVIEWLNLMPCFENYSESCFAAHHQFIGFRHFF